MALLRKISIQPTTISLKMYTQLCLMEQWKLLYQNERSKNNEKKRREIKEKMKAEIIYLFVEWNLPKKATQLLPKKNDVYDSWSSNTISW